MPKAPLLRMNDGLMMPAFGLGTWLAKKGEVGNAVKAAIDVGYRHFDCALLYQNEKEIGEAINEKINDGTVKREELFIVSKLWNTYHSPELVVKSCRKTLKNFGLDYIDLLLIHWPMAFKATENGDKDSVGHGDWDAILNDPEFWPKDESGKIIFSDNDITDTWREMERCVELGLTKSIGLSNFNSVQIEKILKNAKIKPVTNQVEAHPYLQQKKLLQFCKKHGIIVTAYSPLGSPERPDLDPNKPRLLQNPKLLKVAEELGKTPGQVALRYLVELGHVPIPKSTNIKRLTDNISIFDFELTPEQKAVLGELDCNDRTCLMAGSEEHPEYPFNIEY